MEVTSPLVTVSSWKGWSLLSTFWAVRRELVHAREHVVQLAARDVLREPAPAEHRRGLAGRVDGLAERDRLDRAVGVEILLADTERGALAGPPGQLPAGVVGPAVELREAKNLS